MPNRPPCIATRLDASSGTRPQRRCLSRATWLVGIAFSAVMGAGAHAAASDVPQFQPLWNKPTTVVKTALAMEVCVEPPMRREKRTHDPLFHTLADLNGRYSRLAFWFPYPKMAVAELEPPTQDKVSWDFTLLDPIVIDFMKAANGRPVMVNFSTIPEWMFKAGKDVRYPSDTDEIDWTYEKGTELRDPSLQEVRDYFTRVVSWYTKGGFTDEHGHRHESGYHFKFDVWEVLNEVDFEHHLSPQLYTKIYDEVVGALRPLDPQMQFSGPALAAPALQPEFLEYFLDQKNHKPGIPINFASYHFYAAPEQDESTEVQDHTFFTQMDAYVADVRFIELTRKRLSPQTKTYINELGTMTTDNFSLTKQIPPSYWSLSSAAFAYAYLQLAKLQIDLIAGAELINYPGQVPGASLSDWNTGQPNARYQVLKLLHDQIAPGDRMVEDSDLDLSNTGDPTTIPPKYYAAQGFLSSDGARKVLVVNKRNRTLQLRIPGIKGAHVDYIDVHTGAHSPVSATLNSDVVDLAGFAVAVIHLVK